VIILILYVIALSLCLPGVAWGYIDPGSVSIFLQVIFAFLLGGLLTFKNKVKDGIRSVFHFIFPRKKDASDETPKNNKK